MIANGIDFFSSLPTWVSGGLFAALGFFLRHIWDVTRGRRVTISWAAVHNRISPHHGLTMPKVSILLNDKPCVNLQNSRVEVCNESGRDVADIDLLFTLNEPFTIVEGRGNIVTSAKNLLWTKSYSDTLATVLALPEDQRPLHPSFSYLVRNTEFHLFALNRGDKAIFSFWVHSPSIGDVPNVSVTSEKIGVKIVQRPTMFHTLEIFKLKAAVQWGLPLSVCAIMVLIYVSPPPGLLATFSFVIGLAAAGIGMFAANCIRFFKRLV